MDDFLNLIETFQKYSQLCVWLNYYNVINIQLVLKTFFETGYLSGCPGTHYEN